MEAVSVPFLPAGLWLLVTAGSFLIVLIIFGMLVYQKRRFQLALKDSRDVAQLASRKEQLQADVTGLRKFISEQNEELFRLTSEREEQERIRGELSRLQSECATADQRINESRKEVGELENQRYITAQAFDKLTTEVESLKAQRLTLEDLHGQIAVAHSDLERARKEMNLVRNEADSLLRQISEWRIELGVFQDRYDRLAEKIKTENEESDRISRSLAIKKDELKTILEDQENRERELQSLQAEINGYRKELVDRDALLSEIARLEKMKYQFKDLEEQLENARVKFEEKKTELANVHLEADLLTRQATERRIELDTLKNHHSRLIETVPQLEKDCNQLSEESHQLKAEKERVKAELGKLNVKLDEFHKVEREVMRLVSEKNMLEREIGKLAGQGLEGENTYDDLLLTSPSCLAKNNLPSNKIPYIDEERALEEVRSQLESAGYHFNKRVVKSFHTALKCHDINPLTVLAGVSGTGKTLLPAAYARLMGMHSLVIAVQPRWDSPQDMFGFYNYLEKKYKATDLARALIRMDPYFTVDGLDKAQKRTDRMFLVLLDEMNLARTEYYFSEFLSKLELRRLSGVASKEADREHAKILLDTGPGRAPIPFWVGRNVLFAGTMNEDETTQTLSDKVLDRANVIRFGRPAKRSTERQQSAQAGELPAAIGYLPATQWEGWCKPVQPAAWTNPVLEWIEALNDALTKVGRPCGHRVSQSIMTYVANYPGVNINETFKEAFADQIEQKILPKLRGLDTMEGNTVAFDGVERIIEKTGDETLRKAFEDAKQDNATGMFLWHGVTRQD
jgi:uncharacterized coiled-coil DUF342 family protein